MAKELNEDTGFRVSIKTLIGIGFVIVGCLLLPSANQENAIPTVFCAVAMLAIGTGLVTPCLRALVSRRLNAAGQGTVLGSLQGLQSLGTFLGATIAGLSYDLLGQKSPFYGTTLLLIIVVGLITKNTLTAPTQTTKT